MQFRWISQGVLENNTVWPDAGFFERRKMGNLLDASERYSDGLFRLVPPIQFWLVNKKPCLINEQDRVSVPLVMGGAA